MLKPNTPCVVYRSDGYDKFGMPNEAVARKTLCVIDKLDPYIEKTSVRADSSGSRGFAEEVLITSKLMFSGNEDIKLGDRVQVLDEDFKSESRFQDARSKAGLCCVQNRCIVRYGNSSKRAKRDDYAV